MTTLGENLASPSKRILEPVERLSEVLFALVMVLTFTCSFSVAGAGREQVRVLLIGALGCNLAWGIIDAVLYLLSSFSEMGQNLVRLRALREVNSAQARQIIAHALPPLVVSVLSPSDLENIRQKLSGLADVPPHPQLGRNDWLGALAVFLIVVLSTLPVVIPFALIEDARQALRVSNGIAVLMLFATGCAFGYHAGHRPLRMGLTMVILGAAMVAVTISLGG